MTARYLLLLLVALVLSSCADSDDISSQPKTKQVTHTNPVTGQTTYNYVPADQ